MIRVLFVAVYLVSQLVIKTFGGENRISIGVEPSADESGGKVVTIEVSKKNISGSGVLELSLPHGAVVLSERSEGALFTHNGHTARWSWFRLPARAVSAIITLENAASTEDLEAKFLYSVNNTKKKISTDGGKNGDLSIAAGIESAESEDDTKVTCSRTVTPGEKAGEVKISVTIHKGATTGFARYSDNLPKGMHVESVITDGSSFSVADGKVRFVWVSVPDKETLEISYILSGKHEGKISLHGEYSYLESNKTMKVQLQQMEFDMADASGTRLTQAVPDEVNKAVPVKTTTENKKPVKPVRTPAIRKNNLEYRVQVGAFRSRKVNTAKLQKKFWISEDITSEMHEGFSKFMIGSYGEYDHARNLREVMRNEHGIKSAFVVAYNYGRRITVQEALMISKQKWIK